MTLIHSKKMDKKIKNNSKRLEKSTAVMSFRKKIDKVIVKGKVLEVYFK